MENRTLRCEGVYNFRDYGGYATLGGGRLREGRLYRSANLSNATEDDLRAIGALKLGAVIDLRNLGERQRDVSRFPDDFAGKVLTSDADTGALAPHIEAAVKGVTSVADARTASEAVFADMPFRPTIIASLRNYFKALAETDGATLVHCTVGKDRTGITVALLHTTLGVHGDDIMADFMLTNTSGRFEERLAANIVSVRQAFGLHLGDDVARVLASVEPGFLNAALGAIRERPGDVDSYLRDGVGIDAETLQKVKLRLVA